MDGPGQRVAVATLEDVDVRPGNRPGEDAAIYDVSPAHVRFVGSRMRNFGGVIGADDGKVSREATRPVMPHRFALSQGASLDAFGNWPVKTRNWRV